MLHSRRDLRASDAEREAVAAELGRHFAAGRLDQGELASRVDAAYAARWRSQLLGLLRDLPRVEVPAPPRTPRRLATARRTLAAVALLVLAVLALGALPDLAAMVLVATAIALATAVAMIVVPVALVALAMARVTRFVRAHLEVAPPRRRLGL